MFRLVLVIDLNKNTSNEQFLLMKQQVKHILQLVDLIQGIFKLSQEVLI